jgi:poly(3-hydroxybutyrate) depolymerase
LLLGRNRRNGGIRVAIKCWLVSAAAVTIAVCPACGGSSVTHIGNPQAADAEAGNATLIVENALPANLRRPSGVAGQFPPQSPQIFPAGRYLYGAYAVEQGLTRQVTAERETAVFAPGWRDGAGPAAYAILACNLANFEGPATIGLDWDGAEPAAGQAFAGWANFATDDWVWSTPGVPAPGGTAPYLNEAGTALVAIVVLGDSEQRLAGVRLGNAVIEEGVDVARLFAPAMDFEIAEARAELAARHPVEQDYHYIEDYAEGTVTVAVVSYTVEGLTQFGSLRIPEGGPGTHPIMLLCHGGVAGAPLNGINWLAPLVDDYALLKQFLIVMPVFRGETLDGGSASFPAEGGRNLYDHDADDALALLDCAINHFPQGDSRRIVAVGWSRGAQVALRAAARDARIGGVIALSAWTDEWSAAGQQYALELLPKLADGPLDPSQARHAYSEKLWELKTGAASVWEMRRLLLSMSVAYSAADLPALQLHYGALDETIPIEHAQTLAAWLGWYGQADYQYYVYPEGKHSPSSFSGAGPRVRAMLAEYAQ